jgi:hypothetical protein
MESYTQYHQQQPSAYPHAHQQPQHPNQTSPMMQTQQQPAYGQHPQQQQVAPQHMMPQMGYNAPYMQQPYGVSPSQAAAMATAAASGYPNYSMPSDSGMAMSQTSPRMQSVKTDANNAMRGGPPEQSPQQRQMSSAPGSMPGQMNMPPAQAIPQQMQQMQQQQRRVSHVSASPAVQQPQHPQAPGQPPMSAGGPQAHRPSAPPQQPPQQAPTQPPGGHPQQQDGAPGGQVEESPLYVNAKQFHRILKRRMARQKLEEALRLTNKGRKPYLHESRHNHAMRRPRGPGGRFLTADEVASMEAKAAGKEGANGETNSKVEGVTNGSSKRKAGEAGVGKEETPTKKIKSDEEDDEDEDDGDDDG